MPQKNKVIFIALFLSVFTQAQPALPAEEVFPFQGRIKSGNINIRSDSTVSSEVIRVIERGECVEVVSELYDWYKIRLPQDAPSFIKKELVEPIDEKTAKVSGDIVNIRLKPDEASPILGKVKENEIVNILGEKGGWLKIEPVSNSFGWIHKKFVGKIPKKEIAQSPPAEEPLITVEGVIKPKVITSTATHKLIAADKSLFLLKGSKTSLNSLNSRKARITGKIIPSGSPEGPALIEIIKMEAMD